MPSRSGFREIEHTADLAIEAWAPDLEDLIRQAAAGLYALMGVEACPEPMVTHSIALSAEDRESLLVAFLTELLYRCFQNCLTGIDFFLFTAADFFLHAFSSPQNHCYALLYLKSIHF